MSKMETHLLLFVMNISSFMHVHRGFFQCQFGSSVVSPVFPHLFTAAGFRFGVAV